MRFIEYNDPWQKCSLQFFTKRVTRKNAGQVSKRPLTISAQYGLIDQSEFFDRQIASKDMSGYYLLKNGEFAYNKSYSNDYPWGAVKRLDKYECGALSTLYICFSLDNSIVNSDFLSHYFETNKWHKGVSDIAGEGARNHGLLNMSVEDYFLTKHYLPSVKEQEKISHFLNLITTRIETQSKIIEKLKSQIISISNIMVKAISQKISLGEICVFERKTAHQSSEGLSHGSYPFFTNEEETAKFFDSYDFDGEYIIANTGGKANFKYYNGKFAAMSDCLVIKFKSPTLTNFYSIVFSKLQKYIDYVGFEGSGLKHLNKDWLLKLQVPQFVSEAEIFIKIIDDLKEKLQKEKDILSLYKKQKAYLLSNMFI